MGREKANSPVTTAPELTSRESNVPKKRKKNAPDKPQPEWMFPPDEENPILNPKPKTDEQVRKDKEDRDEALKFLQYKSVTAPMKAAPPGILLTLVGAFLTSYGFNSTSRLFTSQCKARVKLDAWDHELGAKLPKGFPDLVKIYRDWYKEYQQDSEDNASSDEEDSDGANKPKSQKAKKVEENAKKDETSSSSGSDSSDDSDSSMQKKSSASKAKPKTGKKPTKAASSSTSASSTSSESDADDEKESAGAKVLPPKPTVNGLIKNLKRKAGPVDASSSESASESSSEDEKPPPGKKTKVHAKKTASPKEAKVAGKPTAAASKPAKAKSSKKPAAESGKGRTVGKSMPEPVSEDESSSSESDTAAQVKPSNSAKPSKIATPAKSSSDSLKSTDSSATLDGVPEKKNSISSTGISSSPSTSESDPPARKDTKTNETESEPAPKRKRSLSPHSARQAMTPQKIAKKQNTPFQRVAKDTKVDPKLASNAYVSYDYADRAHKDLSVTKGKDFTKEKNKKKRGSYRGGTIDVDGRNGIRFED